MVDPMKRITERNRATVPNRDASLTPTSIGSNQVPPTLNQEVEIPEVKDTSTSRNLSNQVSDGEGELETKQTTIRLESGIIDRIQAECSARKISREVLIEALFLNAIENPQTWETVVDAAQKRAEHRKRVANKRRGQSMQKFC